MVSIYALLVFRHFMPAPWMEWVLMGACMLFDILVVRRAPDIQVTREEIEAKLALGAEPVFLTWGELKTRLAWLALGALMLTGISWYWFTHGQQPVLLSQLLTGGIILVAIAYVSMLGIPMRTKRELKEGETPCLWPLMPFVANREAQRQAAQIASYAFGLPLFHWAAWLMLYYMIKSMGPFEGGPGMTGTFTQYLYVFFVGYCVLLGCIMVMPMTIYTSKIHAIRKQKNSSSNLSLQKE